MNYDNGEPVEIHVPEPQIVKIHQNDPNFEKGNLVRYGKLGKAVFDGYRTEEDELAAYIALPLYPYKPLIPSTNCPPHISGGPLKAKFREVHAAHMRTKFICVLVRLQFC